MFGGNIYVIRLARDDDREALEALAKLDGKRPIRGRALVGEIDGRPAAAWSLEDDRSIADPFRPTSHLLVQLRMRAHSLKTHERTPSVADRVRAVVHAVPAHSPAQA
jgi:hypothetical protein